MKRNHDDKIGILKKPIKILGMSIIEIIYYYLFDCNRYRYGCCSRNGAILGALAAGISLYGMKIGISNMNPRWFYPASHRVITVMRHLKFIIILVVFFPPFSCFVCISYLFIVNIVSDDLRSFGYWGLSWRDFAPNR